MLDFLFVLTLHNSVGENGRAENLIPYSPARLFYAMSSEETVRDVLRGTNQRLGQLSTLSEKSQISVELAFLSKCRQRNQHLVAIDETTRWDYGSLDTIAIALGKEPVLYGRENVKFLDSVSPRIVGLRLSRNWRVPSDVARSQTWWPSPYVGPEDLKKMVLATRKGYFLVPRHLKKDRLTLPKGRRRTPEYL